MTSTTSTDTSTKIPSTTSSQRGVHFHEHFNRNQFEKLINLKLLNLSCHDIKCKNEKNLMKIGITNLSHAFTTIFNLYEKQHKDMVNICNLYNKACAEFSLPLRLKQPSPYDFRRLQRISEMIKGYLPYKNEVNREYFGNNSKQSESMYNENINTEQLNKSPKPKLAEGINGGFQVQNNNSFQNNNNQIKTNESIQNNRKRPIINGYTSSFPNVSPSINSSIKISPSLSVQPPSTSVNMNLILNEKFGYSSPIVAVNLNSPQVNNFNQIKQWNKQIINSNITNNNNCYENNNVQIINGNTQKKFSQQPIQWKPIPTNGEHKKTTTIQQNHSHNLRSLSNIEKLNSKQQQFTTPTASVVIVSGQELLLHELSPINNKKTKFTQQKTCDEVEVIEID